MPQQVKTVGKGSDREGGREGNGREEDMEGRGEVEREEGKKEAWEGGGRLRQHKGGREGERRVGRNRVRNCAFLVANVTKKFALATRISQLVASGRLTISCHDHYTNNNFDFQPNR